MKKNIDRLALAVLAAALLRAPSRAAVRPNAASSPAGTVPSAVNYQGRLVDNGFPVTGLRTVTFRLYDAATAGTLLQAIGPQTVSVDQGLFSTTVSMSTTALAGPLQKYLEVQIGAQVLTPREPLNSVPYALVAKSVEENLAISTVTVGSQFISSGTLAVASIQALNGSSFFSILSPVHMSSSTLILDGNNATALTAVGSVGIGTASPGSKLNVSSGTVVVDGSAATALVLDNSAGLPLLRFRETGVDKGAVKSVAGALAVDGDVATSRALLLNTNSTGNVGVGAPIPGRKLDVDGDAQFGNPGAKSAFATTGALTLAANAGLTLTGASGFVASGSSINAASFWGDGANLANVPAVSVPAGGVTAGTFQNAAYTFQNAVNFPGAGVWNAAGSAGVGTAAPATKLDVNGSAQFGSGAAKSTFTAAGALQLASQLTTPYGGTGLTTSGSAGNLLISNGANWTSAAMSSDATITGAGVLTLKTTGVTAAIYGSATQSPQVTVDANGRVTSAANVTISGTSPIGSTLTNGKIWIGNILNQAAEQTVGTDATLSNAGVLTLAATGVGAGTYNSVTVDAKGRVTAGANPTTLAGYGITDGVPKAGGAMTGPLTMTGGSTITISGNAFSVGGSTLVVTGGNVGIGMTSPTSMLGIRNSSNRAIDVYSPGTTDGLGSNLIWTTDTTGTKQDIAYFGAVQDGANAQSGKFYWQVGNAGVPSIAMTLNKSGNLGIGIAVPLGKVTSLAAAPVSNFTATGPGLFQGEKSTYTWYSTFQGTVDNGQRRTADISAGFNGGAWGNEYLSFGVGNGGVANDAGNATLEKMRIQSNGNVGIGTAGPAVALDIGGQGELGLGVLTTAQVQAKIPGRIGALIYNSTVSQVCVSTGTTIQGYARVSTGATCQ